MATLDALVLGVVEGFTEFLPVSSTAHLILTERLLGLTDAPFLRSFTVVVQLAAVAAVALRYQRELRGDWALQARLAVAFVPTALVGLALYPTIKDRWLGSEAVALGAMFAGGVLLVAFERLRLVGALDSPTRLTLRHAFVVGCCQALAVVPGVSRAAAAIVGAMLLGLSRRSAVEFSFLLAVPTIAAASGYDLLKSGWSFTAAEWQLLGVGSLASFVAAVLGVSFLSRLARARTFTGFGYYRIVFALVVAVVLLR